MSQSTIYRRNVRRLARSEKNIHDNRPPLIRVMAALPFLGYMVSKMQEANKNNRNKLAPTSSFERETDGFSNTVEGNNGAISLALAGVVGTAVLASSNGVRAISSPPLAIMSPQSGLPSPIYFCPKHAVQMRAVPTCCAVLMAASFVARSTKSTFSKL
mmetsp:Transcript_4754/g.2898  ORF Transcript_4754/g.2898 Transcript_4754/m.2898 type:complete len:158 (-) Transcript_4754:115-588(-)